MITVTGNAVVSLLTIAGRIDRHASTSSPDARFSANS
jgi:hypothetical protein